MKILIIILFPIMLLAQQYGSWKEIDSLNIARAGHALLVLKSGNILASGNDISDTIQSAKSCEIYDISTNSWRLTTPMNLPRYNHHMVLLDNGEVLAFGGGTGRKCEIFNPITEEWRMTDSMITSRNFESGIFTKLKDGRILVMGGVFFSTDSGYTKTLNNCEIFDPDSEKWSSAAPMLKARGNFAATLLNDGKVLVTGGNDKAKYLKYCEIYSPNTNTWSETDSLIEARSEHAQILLDDGNVLLVGGTSRDSNGNATPENHCLLFNVQTNKWQTVGEIAAYRSFPGIFKISNKNLIVIGGDDPSTWEIYNLTENKSVYLDKFSDPKDIILQRNKSNVIQMVNSNILVCGGYEYDGTFSPPVILMVKKSAIFDVLTNIKNVVKKTTNNFKLFQNYPNPFNPTTKISYTLPFSSNVVLKIYDILGREIKTLLNKNQNPGKFSITWDGTDNNGEKVKSGIYLIKLYSGKYSSIIKTILLK